MSDSDIVICSVARTPFGRFEGALKGLKMHELAARAIDTAIERAGCAPDDIAAAYIGCGMIGAATLTPNRQAVLLSSLPESTPSLAVDRACCSGMSAIGLGWKDIVSGQAGLVVCGGAENLSATPFLLPRQRTRAIGTQELGDPLLLRGHVVEASIAGYTSEEALRHGIDRVAQDEWALRSHQRYFEANAAGHFDFERFPVEVPGPKNTCLTVTQDEAPRADTSLQKLGALRTVHGASTITAGNAPGLNDGAAFAVIARADVARERGLPVLARIVDYVQVADGPTSGSYTPAIAIGRLLHRNRLDAAGLDLIEINEAFAATPLVSTLRLADGDTAQAEAMRARTNIHGGAVAIGHPLGASGARVTMTLINGLRRRGGGTGAAAICGGFGQGDAVLVRVEV